MPNSMGRQHFAIFYVFALAGGQVDAGFEAFAAIGALNGHELLELAALPRAGAALGSNTGSSP